MSKKGIKNNKQSQKKRKAEKEQIKKQITKVFLANPDKLEDAAEKIAPEFDYEFEAKGLAIEERDGPLPEAKVSKSSYPKAYKPKSKAGQLFLRDANQKMLLLTILVLIVMLAWYGYYWKTIVSQAVTTTAEIFGEKVEFKQIPGTVRENLAFNNIEYDADDEATPALNKRVDTKEKIKLDEVHYSSVKKTEEVKHETYVELDPHYESGVQEETKGNDGKGVFKYNTKFVNGKVDKVDKKRSYWIKKPHDTILHLGTMRTGHKAKCKISKTFTANCSAYWMGNNARGASGGYCVYGTVAVDRFRYPYGTEFWIEGYGYAVANDCGSAIIGDKLDLWMDSYGESCRWGRRHMTTYVLKDVKK